MSVYLPPINNNVDLKHKEYKIDVYAKKYGIHSYLYSYVPYEIEERKYMVLEVMSLVISNDSDYPTIEGYIPYKETLEEISYPFPYSYVWYDDDVKYNLPITGKWINIKDRKMELPLIIIP